MRKWIIWIGIFLLVPAVLAGDIYQPYLSDPKDSFVYCPKQWRRDINFELCQPGWKRY